MSTDDETFELRGVEERDFEQWAAMRHALWPANTVEELRQSCRDFFAGEGDQWFVLVAATGNELLGFVEVSLRGYAEGAQSSPTPFIEAWFVAEPHRERGIARALLAEVEDLCKADGYTEICSDALEENDVGQEVHESLGFEEVERIVCFHKTLS